MLCSNCVATIEALLQAPTAEHVQTLQDFERLANSLNSCPNLRNIFIQLVSPSSMHAIRKVEELRGSDTSFAEDVDLLRRVLEG